MACAGGVAAVYSFMFGVTTSDDYRPVTWMGRYPVDVTTILVAAHVACAILTALLFAIGYAGILNYAMFDSAQIWLHGQVWRVATYAFIHPLLVPRCCGSPSKCTCFFSS